MMSLPTQLAIGDLEVAPNILLSPMSGVTDMPFRRLIARCSAGHVGLMMTEFIAVEQLVTGIPTAQKQLRFSNHERPIAIQLFGAALEPMLRAAELVEASPGERILDLCAAPGGKTAVLAASGAHVVACDVSEDRLNRQRWSLAYRSRYRASYPYRYSNKH